jgi:hypothetical protein
MFSKFTVAALTFLFLALVSPRSVQADPVVLTLNNAWQSGTPGTVLIFNATYINPGTQPFMITGDIYNPGLEAHGLRPLGLVIPAGATITTPLFWVEIAANAIPGVYSYTVFSEGFNPGGLIEASNMAPFTITVLASTLPEPATLLLLGTGLAVVIGATRRKA